MGQDETARLDVPIGVDEVARLGAAFAKILGDLHEERRELERRVVVRTLEVERLAAESRYATIVRERLQIARDLHDTLAHSMMAMLSEIRLMRRLHRSSHGRERPRRIESLRAARYEALRAGRPAACLNFCADARGKLKCRVRNITRSYRIRVYPNGAQRRLRDRWFGAYRWLWNTALEIRTEAYRHCELTLTGNDISRWLTRWKRTPGHEWLAAVPATCLTQCLRDQDTAFRNFFAGRAKYPNFKRRERAGSLRFQDAGTAWKRGTLTLPKLGVLKLAEGLPRVDRPDLVTLSLDAAGRYFVSFSAEVAKAPPSLSYRAPAVGVDLGLKHLATLSTGEKIENPKHYRKRLRYLRQQQRCLSRRQKGSRRRERQKLRVARAHAKVREARQYALHELTTRLTEQFDLIFIEDLNAKALSRGRNARAVQDAALGEIRRQLTYKAAWRDKILIDVDRWYPSSKTCSACQHRLEELRLDVREWSCPKCGASHDRDINAARNVLMEGLRRLAGRDDRDLRVDARNACPEEILVQVLAEEARSGQCNRDWMEQAILH